MEEHERIHAISKKIQDKDKDKDKRLAKAIELDQLARILIDIRKENI